LTIDNSPALNNRGIDQDKSVTTATATGSLLQKPVMLAAANLGSCDKNPGKADTILDTGAILGNEGGNIKSWVDPRGDGAKIGRGVDKGVIRPATGKIFEKFEKFSSTRIIYLGKKSPCSQSHRSDGWQFRWI
jgi:hypothetical protein